MAFDFGEVRRWKEGDVLWAENDFIRMAYAVTDDTDLVGSIGLHGPDQLCVEYISPTTAALWQGDDHG
jgi:hypothetical protein